MQESNLHLRGQAELLELILNNIGDPVIAVDATGKLLLFNPAAIRLYGMGILGNSQTKPTDRYRLFFERRQFRRIRRKICRFRKRFVARQC